MDIKSFATDEGKRNQPVAYAGLTSLVHSYDDERRNKQIGIGLYYKICRLSYFETNCKIMSYLDVIVQKYSNESFSWDTFPVNIYGP